jgi:hypothetical protein
VPFTGPEQWSTVLYSLKKTLYSHAMHYEEKEAAHINQGRRSCKNPRQPQKKVVLFAWEISSSQLNVNQSQGQKSGTQILRQTSV